MYKKWLIFCVFLLIVKKITFVQYHNSQTGSFLCNLYKKPWSFLRFPHWFCVNCTKAAAKIVHKKGWILPAYFYSFLLLTFLFYPIHLLLFSHVDGFLNRFITCYEWHFKHLTFFYCLSVACILYSSNFVRYFCHVLHLFYFFTVDILHAIRLKLLRFYHFPDCLVFSYTSW